MPLCSTTSSTDATESTPPVLTRSGCSPALTSHPHPGVPCPCSSFHSSLPFSAHPPPHSAQPLQSFPLPILPTRPRLRMLLQQTLHAGLPPTKGEKWVATKWIHERGYQSGASPDLSSLPCSIRPSHSSLLSSSPLLSFIPTLGLSLQHPNPSSSSLPLTLTSRNEWRLL